MLWMQLILLSSKKMGYDDLLRWLPAPFQLYLCTFQHFYVPTARHLKAVKTLKSTFYIFFLLKPAN